MNLTGKIEKLLDDNEQLTQICKNQEIEIINLEKQKLTISMSNEENLKEIYLLESKIKSKDDKVKYSKEQLNDATQDIEKLQVYK